MSAALMAQPGLHSMATAVSTKAKVNGKNRKRKKSTMAGEACATHGVYLEVIRSFILCWASLWAAWASSRAADRLERWLSRFGKKVLPRGG